MTGALSAGAPAVIVLLLLVLFAILLAGDDDLPGPRKSYAPARNATPLPF